MRHYRCAGPHELIARSALVMPQRASTTRVKQFMALVRAGAPLPPVRVRRVGGRFTIIDGNHRALASAALGLPFVPAVLV